MARMDTTLGIVNIDGMERPLQSIDAISLASRQFAGQSVLSWVVRRMSDAQRLDRVIVLCKNRVDAALVAPHVPSDIDIFTPSSTDGLGRLVDTLKRYSTDAFVRVGLGSPFVDPELIDCLIASAQMNPGCDYITYRSKNEKTHLLAQLGLAAEWFDALAVQRADERATKKSDRNDTTHFVFGHPELFQLRMLELPGAIDREDFRLVINDEQDWEHAQLILDALGSDGLEWHRIAGLLDQHPRITKEMARLNAKEIAAPI